MEQIQRHFRAEQNPFDPGPPQLRDLGRLRCGGSYLRHLLAGWGEFSTLLAERHARFADSSTIAPLPYSDQTYFSVTPPSTTSSIPVT